MTVIFPTLRQCTESSIQGCLESCLCRLISSSSATHLGGQTIFGISNTDRNFEDLYASCLWCLRIVALSVAVQLPIDARYDMLNKGRTSTP